MEFNLTEDQRILQKTAREFGQKEVMPLAMKLDKSEDPAQAVFPLSLFKQAEDLGFTRMLLPEKYGGNGLSVLDYVIIMEELGAADVSFAAAVNGICTALVPILKYGTEAQRDTWIRQITSEDVTLIAIGGSEPDVASSEDRIGHLFPDPRFGIKTYAKPDRDGYVINGTKSAFITLAGLAKYYLITARTDMTKPAFQNISMFFVPANTPGFSVGKPTSKVGWKCVPHAELYLDDCRVPKEALIGEEGKAHECLSPTALIGIAAEGAFAVGLARAAYEYALNYAKQRLVGGEPLIKYQAIAMALVDMKMELDAARMLVWRAACSENFQYSAIAKVYPTEMAVRVSQKSLDILGGMGTSTEVPVEKYVRDAIVTTIAGGTGTVWRLIAGETL